MPKDTINRQLEKAAKSMENIEKVICDVKGFGGAFFLVEFVTENANRARQECNRAAKKCRFVATSSTTNLLANFGYSLL